MKSVEEKDGGEFSSSSAASHQGCSQTSAVVRRPIKEAGGLEPERETERILHRRKCISLTFRSDICIFISLFVTLNFP